MDGHGEIGVADVLAESEERAVLGQVVLGVLDPFVHLDLLHTWIALDVQDAGALEQVFVELLGSAHVQNRIRIAVKLDDLLLLHPRARVIRQEAGAVAPAPLEAELRGQLAQHLGGVGVILAHIPSHRVVGNPRGILDVIDFVPEALQAHDVMNVLPDDPGDGASGGKAHDNDLFALHKCGSGKFLWKREQAGDAIRN